MKERLINVMQQNGCTDETAMISDVLWRHLDAQSPQIQDVLISLITNLIDKMPNNPEQGVIFYTNGVYNNILWGVEGEARNQTYGGLRSTNGELRFEFNLVHRYYGNFIGNLNNDENVQSNNDGSNWSHFVITDASIVHLQALMGNWFN